MDKIFLIRHTSVNIPIGTCYGITDVPLSQTFNEEAAIIQKKLKLIPFNRVYTSPLIRCKSLAEFITNGEFCIDNRLQELNFGNWEGKPWDDIFNTPYGKEWMDNYLELPCPGGESYHELHERAIHFVNDISLVSASVSSLRSVLIITHAGIIRVLLTFFTGIPIDDTFKMTINYGDIIKIEKGELAFL